MDITTAHELSENAVSLSRRWFITAPKPAKPLNVKQQMFSLHYLLCIKGRLSFSRSWLHLGHWGPKAALLTLWVLEISSETAFASALRFPKLKQETAWNQGEKQTVHCPLHPPALLKTSPTSSRVGVGELTSQPAYQTCLYFLTTAREHPLPILAFIIHISHI